MGLKYSEKDILATNVGKMPENQRLIYAKAPQRKTKRRPAEPVEKMTGLEKSFLYYWRLCGGNPEEWLFGQKPFAERPRMHLDFTHATKPIAVEVDGGQWQDKAGHNSGTGVQRDAEKLALCNRYGITLYRLPTSMVNYEEVMKIYEAVTNPLSPQTDRQS